MKVIVVGGTGTIGKAVCEELSQRNTVVTVGHTSGDFQVDIRDTHSIELLYQAVGKFDAVVSVTGEVYFEALPQFTEEQYAIGLDSKLMGQVRLVLVGLKYINKGGSFTLTSGILSHDPILMGTSASMVNGAIDAFVKSAAIELPHHLRINAVSPSVLTESMNRYAPFFRGFESVPASRVALAFSKSVEGAQTGVIYTVK
ncbi:short chain dehydrogenase [Fluoribacter dumoffii]|uniref:Short chain dehydrogenase n=1 Tax=Fluoribacter dumoffii TaxID=463 RepID=A0A377GE78_9GAMM|nr:short chain dehydrogenase [Fluoribacter dumoffii]KTC91105.1 short chain dehydrogenase [Fluoribacter dumoffii NY 23]MCW8387727.1 short chain dehydrogenase [Fluoribacter dumoffii]MCW8416714.1 short chain dehydrogenase [Fluoribacter dumoffii]MCW8455446.1 short chain dehydrogenase [Fluoribacter dumoffii]MCW8460476.1 short chain dehydrogenase [Fluoribacter dumoffii]